LPRTNYWPMAERAEYLRRTPRVSWVEEGETQGRPVTEFFRMGHRKRLAQSGERTLISALVPPGVGNIPSGMTTAFRDNKALLSSLVITASLVADFFIKSSARADLTQGGLGLFPLIEP